MYKEKRSSNADFIYFSTTAYATHPTIDFLLLGFSQVKPFSPKKGGRRESSVYVSKAFFRKIDGRFLEGSDVIDANSVFHTSPQ